MAIIGPALGYVVGGELLKLYTDFITVDPSKWVFFNYANYVLRSMASRIIFNS